MQQRLHFGVTPWRYAGAHFEAADLVAQACKAERLGYASFWLPESHFVATGAIPDPLMWLAAVAAATRHIRLATTSYLLSLRHPLQAAEQVAVLDQLSAGRVILGVGRGFQDSLFQAFGLAPKEKRMRFERCLSTMQRAWSGEVLGQDQNAPVYLAPPPVQRPHPPIWAAAFGPKAIEQAARLGLPYLASPVETLQHLQENYARHKGFLHEWSHPEATVVPVMRTTFVSDDVAEIAVVEGALKQQIRQLRKRGTEAVVRAAEANVRDWALLGNARSVAAQIEEYRATLGMTHLIITRLRLNTLPVEMLEASVERVADVLMT